MEVCFSISTASYQKKQTTLWKVGKEPKSLICDIGCTGSQSTPPKSVQYPFTKFGRMNATDPKKGAKIILKLLILTWRPALRKNQGGPSNREKLRECFILDSGCTGWQNTPQNLLNINLPNLVGWLQETLRKEQKLFRSDTFQLDGKFFKKNKAL